MPAVQIKEEIYTQIEKICVNGTIKIQKPVKQGAMINALLKEIITENKINELIEIYISSKNG